MGPAWVAAIREAVRLKMHWRFSYMFTDDAKPCLIVSARAYPRTLSSNYGTLTEPDDDPEWAVGYVQAVFAARGRKSRFRAKEPSC